MTTCDACDKVSNKKATGYWYLNNYHGLTGMVCETCFQKVRHNAFDEPTHPKAFDNTKRKMAEKMADKRIQP